MKDFVLVLVLASVAALLTFLGAPAAERLDVPDRIVSAALQFTGGISTEPLAFVTIEIARQHGTPRETRRRLAY